MIVLLQLLHAAILWLLEFAPYPELFVYPYLASSGFLPYRHILDQHFPGLMFFPLNFFSLGFRDPLSFKILLILVVLLTSALIYKISRSWLAVLFYTLWQPFFEGNQLWLDIFLPLFTLPAFYFFSRNSWILAGLSLGLGVVFKQTLVPLVAFASLILLWRKDFRALFRFSIAVFLPSALMLAYFYRHYTLADFWYWTVQFNLSVFAASGRLAPRLQDLAKLSLPLAFIAFSYTKIPASRKYIAWLLFAVIGGIARFGLIHLQPAVPFFALAMSTLTNNKKLLILFISFTFLWQSYFYFHQQNWLQTKYFEPEIYTLASQIKQLTTPGDKIFLLGVNPHLYSLTSTVPPGRTFVFQFPWFLQVAGQRVLQTLQTDPPQLIVYNPQSVTDGQYLSDYASYLVKYMRDSYHYSASVGPYHIYESRP